MFGISQNLGNVDRGVRFVAGVALFFARVPKQDPLIAIIASVLMLTSLLGTSPLYQLLGISTANR